MPYLFTVETASYVHNEEFVVKMSLKLICGLV